MTLIDGPLPSSAVTTLSSESLFCYISNPLSQFAALFQFFAQLALVAIGSSYIAIMCPVMILAVYLLQNFYLRTSRQLRFLDLECQSPLYTHVAETLEGLSTIRVFGWQEAFMKSNIERLDTSQRPYYLLYCIQRWLVLVLQLFIAVMAVTVMALATNLTSTTSSGRLGVSLSQIVTFNSSLGSLLTFWTMMETSLGAIARLKGFQEGTKSEDKPEETFNPSEDWPNDGAIQFKNVSASYG
jgi:ABC-type multidrug transport system fused ATPase/permease subunit